jgi:hypothetical protein
VSLDLEKVRMRDEITGQVRKQEEQRASSQAQLQLDRVRREFEAELREKSNHIDGLRKELEAAHRKASAGPRAQEKGIARQELFGEELQARWPGDDIRIVGRGERGGDVVHVVRDGSRDCGTIMWECKNQQRWQRTWLTKLAQDVERQKAAFGVIVTAALPPEIHGSGRIGDATVCDFSLAVHLADGFRQILITASQYESANLARQDSAGKVYDYITTGGFSPRLAKVIDWARAEQQILNKERDYYLGQWAQRETGHQ